MCRLTDRILQHLEKDLKKFHDLFSGGRCQAWQQWERIARMLYCDLSNNEKKVWKVRGYNVDSTLTGGAITIQI